MNHYNGGLDTERSREAALGEGLLKLLSQGGIEIN